MQKLTIGISACLLGKPVRYDGGHKLDPFLRETFGKYIEWVPLCPEAEAGLPVPREIMNLVDFLPSPRLITVWTRIDHTARVLRWTKKKLAALERFDISGFVFKARSPSCGLRDAAMFTPNGALKGKGPGIFAGELVKRFPLLPVEDEGALHGPVLRDNFIERIFAYKRWRKHERRGGAAGELARFHDENELLIMAHSRKHYRILGKLMADAKQHRREELRLKYIELLMGGMQFPATTKKNAAVLRRAARYFGQRLSAKENRELQEAIQKYHQGLAPLIVPITLIQHHVKKFDVDYLTKQHYLFPHPLELMLRNHA